ncbi:MAG: hypothetical protein J6S74_00270 [Alphaproteobacteria bacterium]|nr:hypothetical protein [Alphaproteobacteria bacterium]
MQTVKNNMAQVAKTQKPKNKRKMIMSPADFTKLKQAHAKLYAALFRRELLAGKTIGAASHNAFEIIKAKIKTMDRGPVRRMLNFINAVSSRRTKKRIMPSKNRDAVVAFMPEKRREFVAKIPQDISNALGVINTLSAQYKPKQKSVAKPAQKPVTQPVQKPAKPNIQKQSKRILSKFVLLIADPRAFATAHGPQHER